MRLNQNVDHVAILIHGALLILLFAIDANEYSHPSASGRPVVPLVASISVPNQDRIFDTTADRVIGHDDAEFSEKILDISEAQAKAMIRPDSIS